MMQEQPLQEQDSFLEQTGQILPKLHALCSKTENLKNNAIQDCLDQRFDINSLCHEGLTALYHAVNNKHADIVRYLLSRGANPNIIEADLVSPLAWAVYENSTEIFEILVNDPSTDINLRNEENITALFMAIASGRERMVSVLLEKGAQAIQIKNADIPFLFYPFEKQHHQIAKILISKFPELTSELSHGMSLLENALDLGWQDIAIMLANLKVHINLRSLNQTPLYTAAKLGHNEVIPALLANGADYTLGCDDTNGLLITTIEIAARNGQVEAVKCLLACDYSMDELEKALHYAAANSLRTLNAEKRKKQYLCSELILEVVTQKREFPVLDINQQAAIEWDKTFEAVFSELPKDCDRFPKNKPIAIRHALISMKNFLDNPRSCIPYLKYISNQLELYWKEEHQGAPFPDFDFNSIEFWFHENHLWPIPNEQFKPLKKGSLLNRILLDIFQQNKMGKSQSRWTGFVSAETANTLIFKNEFFTENRRTLAGPHGNMHPLQCAVSLLAMKTGDINLSFHNEQGQPIPLEPQEVFSALVSTDILAPYKREVLWPAVLDSFYTNKIAFSGPHSLHSFLLTNPLFAESALQKSLLFSFCAEFNKMRTFLNHTHGWDYSNIELCTKELTKLCIHIFSDLAEIAIQDRERPLEEVDTIETLQNEGRAFAIHSKQYQPLEKHVPQPTVYPSFLQGVQKKKLTAGSVGCALWRSKHSQANLEISKIQFLLWSKKHKPDITLEAVEQCYQERYSTQKYK